jgi:1,4-dihydroxy-2-naphthoyl-CoA hydrolase
MPKDAKKTARKRTKVTGSTAVPDVSHVLAGGMPRTLGVRIVSVTRKKVVGEMTITDTHLNLNGRVNGGAIMSFGDVLGAAGAVANRPPGYRGGTIESKTNFFAGGKGPKLSGVSIALHVGRTTSVWQTTIKNADGRMVAIVTQTQISVPAGSAEKE